MFDKEAIQELAQAEAVNASRNSIESALQSTTDYGLAALPGNFLLHNLEAYLPNRRRARGTMSTKSMVSFAVYAIQHNEAGAVFIDSEKMRAVAVLNLGASQSPGHADNRAVFEAERTAAYAALRSVANGQGLTQQKVAEFLEDWVGCIQCFADGAEVQPGKAIAAVRKITIEATRKLESTEQQLSAAKSTFESVAATSTETLPTHIYFTTHPYPDLSERTFVLRLGILTGGDKPQITLRITKLEEHEEAMAQELAANITRELKTLDTGSDPMQVLLGTYAAGN
jgi:uncharacterized protein YfdQ (DUF2303 family)